MSLFCVAIVTSEPFIAGAYFRPDFAVGLTEAVWSWIFLVLSETGTKEIHFEIVFGSLYLGDKNRPILFFSRKSSVVS